MFQYTNTIVLNSLVDEESKLKKIQDLTNGIHILRVNRFIKDNVVALYKRPAEDAVAGYVEMPAPGGSASDLYRYRLYVRLSGSQNSYYANDFVFKGKPFVFEFSGDKTASDIVKIINKIKTIYGDKFLKVTLSGDKVRFTGDNYTNFTVAKLEKFTTKELDINGGTWEESKPADTIVPCNNGFGTYEQLLKDLRLPTMDARRWEAVNKEELPIPGEKYDQFIIEYQVNRGLMGGAAVGQQVTSRTTHVFYVKQDISGEFETYVKKLAHDSVNLETITKPLSMTVAAADGEVAQGGETEVITVTTSDTLKTITGTSDQAWLTQTASDPTSAKTVTMTATSNDTGAERTAKVIVTAVNNKGAVATATVDITQAGE